MTNSLNPNTITQVSILNALLSRRFDGYKSCRELLKYGDFGTGTFDRMEGEMIIVDGTIYQAKADGRVYKPDLDIRTPFATVCRFHPDETWTLKGSIDFDGLCQAVDSQASNPNVFCAIRVEGTFPYMKIHALQIQSEPYPPIVEVVRGCVQYEMKDVSGTIVGFRCPPHVKGINDVGFHLHFLSHDKTQGGHILSFVMDEGSCAINTCSNHLVILPEGGAVLAGLDLRGDLVDEFHQALHEAETEGE